MQGGGGDGNRRRRLAMVNASRVKVGGGDGLSSACKYFTLHSSQFSFRLGVSQSHNFASTLSGSDTHPYFPPVASYLFQRTLSPCAECTCFNHLVRFAFGPFIGLFSSCGFVSMYVPAKIFLPVAFAIESWQSTSVALRFLRISISSLKLFNVRCFYR